MSVLFKVRLRQFYSRVCDQVEILSSACDLVVCQFCFASRSSPGRRPAFPTPFTTIPYPTCLSQMLAKFAEDDRIEQMNAQKRRMKQLEHRRAVERLLEARRAQYAAEREREAAEFTASRNAEALHQRIVEEERHRLLQEHASRLLGYLPKVTCLLACVYLRSVCVARSVVVGTVWLCVPEVLRGVPSSLESVIKRRLMTVVVGSTPLKPPRADGVLFLTLLSKCYTHTH